MEMGFWLCLARKKKTCFIWTTRVKGLSIFIDLLFETDAMQAALYINSSVQCMSFPCKLILKFRMEGDISLSKKVIQKAHSKWPNFSTSAFHTSCTRKFENTQHKKCLRHKKDQHTSVISRRLFITKSTSVTLIRHLQCMLVYSCKSMPFSPLLCSGIDGHLNEL